MIHAKRYPPDKTASIVLEYISRAHRTDTRWNSNCVLEFHANLPSVYVCNSMCTCSSVGVLINCEFSVRPFAQFSGLSIQRLSGFYYLLFRWYEGIGHRGKTITRLRIFMKEEIKRRFVLLIESDKKYSALDILYLCTL